MKEMVKKILKSKKGSNEIIGTALIIVMIVLQIMPSFNACSQTVDTLLSTIDTKMKDQMTQGQYTTDSPIITITAPDTASMSSTPTISVQATINYGSIQSINLTGSAGVSIQNLGNNNYKLSFSSTGLKTITATVIYISTTGETLTKQQSKDITIY